MYFIYIYDSCLIESWLKSPVIDYNLIIYISYSDSKNNFILQSVSQWITESVCSVI